MTIDRLHLIDVKIRPSNLDRSIYYFVGNGNVKGLSEIYVDEILRGRDEDFHLLASKTSKTFDMDADGNIPVDFAGRELILTRKKYQNFSERVSEEPVTTFTGCDISHYSDQLK